MTVSTTVNRKQHNGNGATTAFGYPFKIGSSDEIIVTVDDVVQTLTTHYTLTGIGSDSGGDVNFLSPPATGVKNITLERDVPLTQTLDLLNRGDFHSESIEDAFDKLTFIAQQLDDAIARSAKLPPTSPIDSVELPLPDANKYIRWNSAETALEAVSLTTSVLAVSAFVETLLDDTDAATARATLGTNIVTGGNILCPHKNLIIEYKTASTVDVNADAVLLTNPDGDQIRYGPLDDTVDIDQLVAGGLDMGSEATATWYYIWAIGHYTGAVRAMLSTSATDPTMPIGYLHKGLLGAVRNDSGGDFRDFYQFGNVYRYRTSFNNPLTSGASTSFASVDFSGHVPAPVRNARVLMTQATGGYARLSPTGTGTTAGGPGFTEAGASGSSSTSTVDVDLAADQTLKYYVTANTVSLTTLGFNF